MCPYVFLFTTLPSELDSSRNACVCKLHWRINLRQKRHSLLQHLSWVTVAAIKRTLSKHVSKSESCLRRASLRFWMYLSQSIKDRGSSFYVVDCRLWRNYESTDTFLLQYFDGGDAWYTPLAKILVDQTAFAFSWNTLYLVMLGRQRSRLKHSGTLYDCICAKTRNSAICTTHPIAR